MQNKKVPLRLNYNNNSTSINKYRLKYILTGSQSLDRFLGGGIPTGLITDIFGEVGSGKSQFCFTLCANLLKNTNDKIIFIDTVGTFRPERIIEIAEITDIKKLLNRINYIRPYSIDAQFNSIKKIEEMKPRLVIIDTLTSIFAGELNGIARHLVLMKFIHELALSAIRNNCAVITTNNVRNIVILKEDKKNNGFEKNESKNQIEFMEGSVSISTHIRLKFEIINIDARLYKMTFIQPQLSSRNGILFTINKKGIVKNDMII